MNTPKFSPRLIVLIAVIALFASSACRVASEFERWAVSSPFAFTALVVLGVAVLLALASGKR